MPENIPDNIKSVILTVILTALMGFCSWMVSEIMDIKDNQTKSVQYITTLNEHSKDLDDHELRLRYLEKRVK